jgi:hypothetical protein
MSVEYDHLPTVSTVSTARHCAKTFCSYPRDGPASFPRMLEFRELVIISTEHLSHTPSQAMLLRQMR